MDTASGVIKKGIYCDRRSLQSDIACGTGYQRILRKAFVTDGIVEIQVRRQVLIVTFAHLGFNIKLLVMLLRT